ncbi:MAG: SAM-dependent methyltransferase, partial [Desulfuromusa sp.]|nr:SAM-dependent methyltransferase [Desulfuromusa sp.]
MAEISLNPIGSIKTPYLETAPYQPVDTDDQEFYLQLKPEYVAGLKALDSFTYIYVLYFIDRLKTAATMEVSPPWAAGKKIGLFASRSPVRPNPIG